MDMLMDTAYELARAIEQDDAFQEMRRLKAAAMEDETNAALLREYKRVQGQIQRGMLGGGAPEPEVTQRFQQVATLLYMNPDVKAYLMAEMLAQKRFADVIKALSDAAGFALEEWLGQ
jgi:cell fate (sporulation/competence/biofilm development) regulator YlbF (YheA/YmcA/DUF963 family)